FGVHAYADGAGDRVAVAEGTVAVAVPAAPAAGETPLRAGQVATLSSAGAVHVLRGANVTAELAWIRGRLVFGSLPLGEAAQRLAWRSPRPGRGSSPPKRVARATPRAGGTRATPRCSANASRST